MRRMNTPPRRRASSQLNSAVRAPPTCRYPVGDGAKRTRIVSVEFMGGRYRRARAPTRRGGAGVCGQFAASRRAAPTLKARRGRLCYRGPFRDNPRRGTGMLTDIEIAQQAVLRPIVDIARNVG